MSTHSTVIADDRQGRGRMINQQPRTAKQVVSRLLEILHKINAHPPYIIVAHAIGGPYASYFAREYPKQIAGMVTLDVMKFISN